MADLKVVYTELVHALNGASVQQLMVAASKARALGATKWPEFGLAEKRLRALMDLEEELRRAEHSTVIGTLEQALAHARELRAHPEALMAQEVWPSFAGVERRLRSLKGLKADLDAVLPMSTSMERLAGCVRRAQDVGVWAWEEVAQAEARLETLRALHGVLCEAAGEGSRDALDLALAAAEHAHISRDSEAPLGPAYAAAARRLLQETSEPPVALLPEPPPLQDTRRAAFNRDFVGASLKADVGTLRRLVIDADALAEQAPMDDEWDALMAARRSLGSLASTEGDLFACVNCEHLPFPDALAPAIARATALGGGAWPLLAQAARRLREARAAEERLLRAIVAGGSGADELATAAAGAEAAGLGNWPLVHVANSILPRRRPPSRGAFAAAAGAPPLLLEAAGRSRRAHVGLLVDGAALVATYNEEELLRPRVVAELGRELDVEVNLLRVVDVPPDKAVIEVTIFCGTNEADADDPEVEVAHLEQALQRLSEKLGGNADTESQRTLTEAILGVGVLRRSRPLRILHHHVVNEAPSAKELPSRDSTPVDALAQAIILRMASRAASGLSSYEDDALTVSRATSSARDVPSRESTPVDALAQELVLMLSSRAAGGAESSHNESVVTVSRGSSSPPPGILPPQGAASSASSVLVSRHTSSALSRIFWSLGLDVLGQDEIRPPSRLPPSGRPTTAPGRGPWSAESLGRANQAALATWSLSERTRQRASVATEDVASAADSSVFDIVAQIHVDLDDISSHVTGDIEVSHESRLAAGALEGSSVIQPYYTSVQTQDVAWVSDSDSMGIAPQLHVVLDDRSPTASAVADAQTKALRGGEAGRIVDGVEASVTQGERAGSPPSAPQPNARKRGAAALLNALRSGEAGRIIDEVETTGAPVATQGRADRTQEARPVPPATKRDVDPLPVPQPSARKKGAAALLSALRSGEAGHIIDDAEAGAAHAERDAAPASSSQPGARKKGAAALLSALRSGEAARIVDQAETAASQEVPVSTFSAPGGSVARPASQSSVLTQDVASASDSNSAEVAALLHVVLNDGLPSASEIGPPQAHSVDVTSASDTVSIDIAAQVARVIAPRSPADYAAPASDADAMNIATQVARVEAAGAPSEDVAWASDADSMDITTQVSRVGAASAPADDVAWARGADTMDIAAQVARAGAARVPSEDVAWTSNADSMDIAAQLHVVLNPGSQADSEDPSLDAW